MFNHDSGNEVDIDSFNHAMSKLHAILLQNNKESSEFFLSLFLDPSADLKSGMYCGWLLYDSPNLTTAFIRVVPR